MASNPERFDVEKVRNEIFQPRNRDILMITEFVAATAAILRKEGRLEQFVFLVDRSIKLLQGNLILKKDILLLIIEYDFDIERCECPDVLKYYLIFEKMLDDSVLEKKVRVRILLEIGKAYFLTAHYRKTLEHTLKAEKIAIEVKDKESEVICCENLGSAYYKLGDCKNAITYAQKGLEISSEIGNQSGIARNNGNLGFGYLSLAEYKNAIMYFQKSLEIYGVIGDQSGIANYDWGLGNAYSKLSEYGKAILYYQNGLEISSAIGNRSGIASNNRNLGNTYRSLGKYEKAIMYYQKSLEIFREIGDELEIASTNGDLGDTYLKLGYYEKAIMYYQKALTIVSAIGNLFGIPIQCRILGNAYFMFEDYGNVIKILQKCLEICSAIGDRSGIADANECLGNAYFTSGKYEKAIVYYQKGLEISSAIGNRSGIASNNGNLGKAYRNLGQYEKSIRVLMDGLKVSSEIGEQNIESLCLGSIGHTYFLEAKSKFDKPETFSIFQQAVSYLMRSVHYSDQMFSTLVVDKHKISFAKKYFERYVFLMCCFISLKRIEAALLVIDLGKAKALRAFREKVKKSKIDASMDLTWKRINNNEDKIRMEEIQEALELKSNSSVLLYAFDYENFLNIWVVNSEDGVKTFKHNECLEEIYLFLKFLLINCNVNLNRDSSFHKLDSGFTPGYQMVVHDQLYTKPVKGKSVDAIKQANTPDLGKSETTSSTRFRKQQKDESEFFNYTPATVDLLTEEVFQLLYQVLIHPVKEFIKGTKIIIVPDKLLFFVPFCSLLDENFCRLSENYSLQIAPSLHTLVSSASRSRDPGLGFALFVGNPTVGKVSFRGQEIEPDLLPNASDEVKYLAPLLGAQPLVESEATKERVLKFIHGASIIHIAAHGEPDSGEIFLAPNTNITEQNSSPPKENSYLLKQRDIMKIAINARLVVLCCCHTGKGKVSSEGVVGLARAFLCAGARSVLATLWRIHDEATKGFMKIFYDEICNETSVCEALRKAMNMFQGHENYEFRSFMIWAPFTIYGEDVSFTRDDIEEIKRKSREMRKKEVTDQLQ